MIDPRFNRSAEFAFRAPKSYRLVFIRRGISCRQLPPPGSRFERTQFGHQLLESTQAQLLGTVTPSFRRIRMHFDQQCVGTHRGRAFAHGRDEVCPAASLAGIDDDR